MLDLWEETMKPKIFEKTFDEKDTFSVRFWEDGAAIHVIYVLIIGLFIGSTIIIMDSQFVNHYL